MKTSPILIANHLFDDRAAFAASLIARGLSVAADSIAEGCVRVSRDDRGIAVAWPGQAATLRLSSTISPYDLAGVLETVVALAESTSKGDGIERAGPHDLSASLLAHDAKNLLMPIMLAASALAASRSSYESELATEIADGCAKMASWLNRATSAGRREAAGRLRVNDVLVGLLPSLRSLAGSEVHITTRFEPRLPDVHIHEADLERAVVNLVTNARDAMPHGGRIALSTSVVEEEITVHGSISPGPWVRLDVEDCGCGISPSIVEAIFDPFFTTKGGEGGTGLGLASVRRTVRAASGDVRLRSVAGRGTVVEVWLPAVSHAEEAAPPPHGE